MWTNENATTILDYMPHIIAIVSIIATVVIAWIQHKTNTELHKKNSNYDAKKEAIYEALDFLDSFISFKKTSSIIQAITEPITDIELTKMARRAHNKLCVTCKNEKIVELFLDIVTPDKIPYPIFEYYDNFRNECRKELGFKEIDLSKDKIYIAIVSTKPLSDVKERNNDQL